MGRGMGPIEDGTSERTSSEFESSSVPLFAPLISGAVNPYSILQIMVLTRHCIHFGLCGLSGNISHTDM